MKKILIVFGTRPEAIKMCPLVIELKSRENLISKVCVTGQHRQMLDQVLDAFSVVPDYNFTVMKDKQTLFYNTTNNLNQIKKDQKIYSQSREEFIRDFFRLRFSYFFIHYLN